MKIIGSVVLCVCALWFSLSGCNKSVSNQKNDKASYPSFIVKDTTDNCSCFRTINYLARGELGIAPAALLKTEYRSDSLKSQFQQEADNETFQIVSMNDCIEELHENETGPISMRVLAHQNGHLYGLLGTIDIDGIRLYQLIHGDSQVWLASQEQLEQAGFVEAWKLRREKSEIPIPVGTTTLITDSLYHNFGEIKPGSEVACTFNLRNDGDKTIILSRPETSCTCTVPNIETTAKLEPGKTFPMEIRLLSGQSTSTRQTVGMKCYEEGSGEPVRFSLDLLASQRRSLEVVPTGLDFGLVVPGEEVTRTVMLKEVPTDRFSISKVDVGDLPLTWTKQESTALDGMEHYQFDLKFTLADEKIEGEQQGEIVFTTDSRQRPQVRIPVVYEATPLVRAIPSIISFGTVKVGEKAYADVEFISRNGDPVEVEVESLPEGVTFEKKENAYQVGFVSEKNGIWTGMIRLSITFDDHERPLPLKCVAFVQY